MLYAIIHLQIQVQVQIPDTLYTTCRGPTSKNVFWLLHTPPVVYGAYTRLILTLKTSFCTIIPLTNLWAPLGRFCERVATLAKYKSQTIVSETLPELVHLFCLS